MRKSEGLAGAKKGRARIGRKKEILKKSKPEKNTRRGRHETDRPHGTSGRSDRDEKITFDRLTLDLKRRRISPRKLAEEREKEFKERERENKKAKRNKDKEEKGRKEKWTGERMDG